MRAALTLRANEGRRAMGVKRTLCVASGLVVLCGGTASAQNPVVLPTVDVIYSRWGGFVPGASNSTITAEEIERLPSQNLPDILAQLTGIQTQNLLGGT